ncbi:MAG: hypothetical protein RMJ84_05740 [Sandaracinaceae bacterium]|nr:hypothetical protein [Sandaracinaceae bacterium]
MVCDIVGDVHRPASELRRFFERMGHKEGVCRYPEGVAALV